MTPSAPASWAVCLCSPGDAAAALPSPSPTAQAPSTCSFPLSPASPAASCFLLIPSSSKGHSLSFLPSHLNLTVWLQVLELLRVTLRLDI